MRPSEAMKEMCDSCPFGHGPKQTHMRKSLARGRFNDICQSVWQGADFQCHKTTDSGDEDEEGNYIPSGKELTCRGALNFVEAALQGRRDAEKRTGRTAR